MESQDGASWTQLAPSIVDNVAPWLMQPGPYLVAQLSGKLYQSEDQGETWELLYDDMMDGGVPFTDAGRATVATNAAEFLTGANTSNTLLVTSTTAAPPPPWWTSKEGVTEVRRA